MRARWFFIIHGERLFDGKLQGFYTSRTAAGVTVSDARESAQKSVSDEFGEFVLKIEEERLCDHVEHRNCPNKGAVWYDEEYSETEH